MLFCYHTQFLKRYPLSRFSEGNAEASVGLHDCPKSFYFFLVSFPHSIVLSCLPGRGPTNNTRPTGR